MAIWFRVVSGLFSLSLLILVLDAAIRTFLLPRAARVRLSQLAASTVNRFFRMLATPKRSYQTRDRILSLLPSIVLLTYQALWLILALVAFAFGFIAAGVPHFARAFEISGSSIFTLGTSRGMVPLR